MKHMKQISYISVYIIYIHADIYEMIHILDIDTDINIVSRTG